MDIKFPSQIAKIFSAFPTVKRAPFRDGSDEECTGGIKHLPRWFIMSGMCPKILPRSHNLVLGPWKRLRFGCIPRRKSLLYDSPRSTRCSTPWATKRPSIFIPSTFYDFHPSCSVTFYSWNLQLILFSQSPSQIVLAYFTKFFHTIFPPHTSVHCNEHYHPKRVINNRTQPATMAYVAQDR